MNPTTLAVTAVMALAYLLAVRLIDLNEKEPWWAVLTLFALGAGAAVVLQLLAPTTLVELTVLPGVLLKELARFAAVGSGFSVLALASRRRGYSEVNGLMDGVVYGSAGGLGFATGLSLARELLGPAAALELATPSAASYGQLALVGLSDGVFGALMGVAFTLWMQGRTATVRSAAPLGGYLAAVAAHLLYDFIGKGNAVADSGLLRRWVAILLPVAVVGVVVVVALRREKQAITTELGGEADTGAVSAKELSTLQSFWARQRQYLGALGQRKVGIWSSLHNRQVQLALAKQRAARERDEGRRASLAREVATLRASVFECKRALGLELPATAQVAAGGTTDDVAGAGNTADGPSAPNHDRTEGGA